MLHFGFLKIIYFLRICCWNAHCFRWKYCHHHWKRKQVFCSWLMSGLLTRKWTKMGLTETFLHHSVLGQVVALDRWTVFEAYRSQDHRQGEMDSVFITSMLGARKQSKSMRSVSHIINFWNEDAGHITIILLLLFTYTLVQIQKMHSWLCTFLY